MRRILITTNTRFRDYSNNGTGKANLYIYDFDTNSIVDKIEFLVDRHNESRSAGFRGLDYHNDYLYVATSNSSLYIFDPITYRLLDEIKLSDNLKEYEIHQIKTYKDDLYITGTKNNTLIKLNNDKVEIKKLEFYPFPQLHFNAIGFLPNGDMLHLYKDIGCLYNYSKNHLMFKVDDQRNDFHDLEVIDDQNIVLNSSFLGITWIYNTEAHNFTTIRDLNNNEDDSWSKKGYTRGVVNYKDYIFLGRNPFSIDLYNRETNKLIELIKVTDDIEEVIFDMILHKDDWN